MKKFNGNQIDEMKDAVRERGSFVVDYQPGNGTRYELLFIPAEGKLVGSSENDWYVAWVNHGVGMHMTPSYKHFNYVMEKLGCGIADAEVLANLVNAIFMIA